MTILFVTPDMRLDFSQNPIGYDGESALIFAVSQPESLDAYHCRAEYETDKGKGYFDVCDKTFTLPRAVEGGCLFQLVYSDDTEDVVRKTSVAAVRVGRSINALTEALFTLMDADGNTLTDSNGYLLQVRR